jgi:small subunit ribosomal protein S4
MSRSIGPRVKVMRALGIDLPGLSRKSIEQRSYPPGQHGQKQKRKSSFGTQLIEKQKLRANYGLSERQLRRLFVEARQSKTPTGDKLVELLERRLDNVVFRAGFAPTIPAARQLVSHRHVRVNGKLVNIPSYRVRVGDAVELREASRNLDVVKGSLAEPALTRPEWLAWDETAVRASVGHLPAAEDVPFPVELQQIVEYYSNRI